MGLLDKAGEMQGGAGAAKKPAKKAKVAPKSRAKAAPAKAKPAKARPRSPRMQSTDRCRMNSCLPVREIEWPQHRLISSGIGVL